MIKKIRSFIAYPILFSIYPIISFYIHNINEVNYQVILIPILITLGISLFFWLIVNFFLKDWRRSAIVVFLYQIFFFSYGHIFNIFYKATGLVTPVKLESWFFISWIAVFFILSISLISKINTNNKLTRITDFFNIVTGVLILISVVQIIYGNTRFWLIVKKISPKKLEEIKSTKLQEGKKLPDIYYLIFDRYANIQSLKKYYNYDNSEFIDFLTEKGFYVANESYANYPITDLSLTSSLNMEYLDSLSQWAGKKSTDYTAVHLKLMNRKVVELLKKKGYFYINLGSTWGQTQIDRNADINYQYNQSQPSSVFIFKFLETTILSFFYSNESIIGDKIEAEPLTYERLSRKITLEQFKIIPEIPNLNKPKFVFAHILLPHTPYVFNEDGSYVTKEKAATGDGKKLYINQLIYGNKLIETMVKKLLVKTNGQAIIVLQADEGPFPARYEAKEYTFKWKEATIDEYREKLGILNAYYFPNSDYKILYPKITPVNSFRLIFSLYLDENLPLLPDKNYLIEDRKHPYNYLNVTDKL